jgi:hypothetical protein
MEKEIAALLRKPKDELTFDGDETQNFKYCNEAYRLFKRLTDMADHNNLIAGTSFKSKKERTDAYLQVKPDHIKKQQTKHYLNL